MDRQQPYEKDIFHLGAQAEFHAIIDGMIKEGFNTAKTKRGCRGAVKRTLKKLGFDYFEYADPEFNGIKSVDRIIFGTEEAPFQWTVEVTGMTSFDNPKFYLECETGYAFSLEDK